MSLKLKNGRMPGNTSVYHRLFYTTESCNKCTILFESFGCLGLKVAEIIRQELNFGCYCLLMSNLERIFAAPNLIFSQTTNCRLFQAEMGLQTTILSLIKMTESSTKELKTLGKERNCS